MEKYFVCSCLHPISLCLCFIFHEYVTAVCSFLNNNVKNAYKKPEAILKSTSASTALFHLASMQLRNWDSAEQNHSLPRLGDMRTNSILIEELLATSGYETKQAWFKDIDYAWAEVKYNGTWLIIDPWYIGILKEAHNLKTLDQSFKMQQT